MNTEQKIVGQKYPAKCLVDNKTGLSIMIEHSENSDEIREWAKESARHLLNALNDPSGLTPI